MNDRTNARLHRLLARVLDALDRNLPPSTDYLTELELAVGDLAARYQEQEDASCRESSGLRDDIADRDAAIEERDETIVDLKRELEGDG